MKLIKHLLVTLALLVVVSRASAQLFSDDFDADHTASWTNSNYAGATNAADFFFDYSSVGIPPAPHSSGGSTRGLKLGANLLGVATPALAGISVSPNGQSFTGNYTLKFDWWHNWLGNASGGIGNSTGGSGSTELSTFGIRTAGTSPNLAGFCDGVFFAATGDGASPQDFRTYASQKPAGFTLGDAPTNTYAAGSQNSSAALYMTLFPAGATAPPAQVGLSTTQTGSTVPGTAGFRWHYVEISQLNNIITWKVNGSLVATVDTSLFTIPTSGSNILFGMSDTSAGAGTPASLFQQLDFTLIDNVTVSSLNQAPTVSSLPATSLINNTATLNATVNPNGLATTAWFEWGTTTNYGNQTPAVSVGNGVSAVAFSTNISVLTPGITNHYRVIATNIDGSVSGNDTPFGLPSVTIIGANLITNECHTIFIDPGASNSAPFGVTVTSFLDTNAPGTYMLLYTGTNIFGGVGTATRTVVVKDTLPPVVTILGANPLTNYLYSAFVDPGATALDACGGAQSLATNSTVITNIPGTYSITYSTQDSFGNTTNKVRTVVIAEPPRTSGVDVSHFQGESGVAQVNWNQMFAEGNKFAFIKATEGLTGPDDAAMSNNVARATAAGLLVGVYHYAHPENRTNTSGAVQEADHFLAYAGNRIGPGYLRPVLDIEGSASSLTTTGLTAWIIAFSDRIIDQRGAGAKPIIYLNRSFAAFEVDSQLANYDLWLAYYTNVNPVFVDPPPTGSFPNPTGVFTNWAFWQYTLAGSAGGISPLDLNVCHDQYKPLSAYVIPALPVLTLLGANPLTNECHFSFTDPGATNSSGFPVTVTGSVNTNAPGAYVLTYIGTNSVGQSATNTRTVVVNDTLPPVLALLGDNPLTNALNVSFVDPGGTALDACGGNLAVTTNDTVNVTIAGTYTNTYTAMDGSGNSATNTRTVVIIPPPVLTLFGANPFTNECHFTFTDPGATNSSGFSVTVSGSVDTNTPGNYMLTYTGTNIFGQGATNFRTVVVSDTLPPVVTLNGVNPFTNVLNAPFVDPGATALDACGGSLPVITNDTVTVSVAGSYTNTYTSTDVFGNTANQTRIVVVINVEVTTPPVLTGLTRLGNGSFQFSFTNQPGANFTIYASTNLVLPFNAWENIGIPLESPAGNYQFTDLQATNKVMRFYRVSSP